MKRFKRERGPLAAWVLACLALAAIVPAEASTFRRAGLDKLVADHAAIVIGEVVETRSYWNEAHSFIFTDVSLKVDEVLKGSGIGREMEITLLGGTVGDRQVLVVGGAALERGASYVLFLSPGNLPGLRGVTTVPEHGQGVFEIFLGSDGLRALSQANGHPLLPDAKGLTEAPGGVRGMPLPELTGAIRDLVEKAEAKPSVRPEVQR